MFVNAFGLPIPSAGVGTNIKVIKVGAGSQNGGAQGEGDLDIQMELGMAPLASILIYDGTGVDLVGSLTKEASDNTADVISESYGWFVGAQITAGDAVAAPPSAAP